MPIVQLPREVSSKIAAGEIIERPASVVKELVENSLDAKTTKVSLEIRSGGIEYIRVSDNGTGVPADEVKLAFSRFATSKLSSIEELESVSTLGFRGEALPSIAAVSSVSFVTRTEDSENGMLVEVTDGKHPSAKPQGAPPGTSVTVRHLFRGFPARRKFLRTPATEASRVQAVLTRYILASPEVGFEMESDGRTPLSSPGSGDLQEAISAVYGVETAEAMLELTQEPSDDEERVTVSGMIGSPSLHWANRSRINIFVNGRWVQDRMLAYALEEACRGFMMERRFPIAVINLGVPHESVDVNVHPAKTEVRFRHQGRVFSALQEAVRRTLTAVSPVPELGRSAFASSIAPARPLAATSPTKGSAGPRMLPSFQAASSHDIVDAAETGPPRPPVLPMDALPVLRVLGQVQTTYIAAEGPDGVYLIDQHAAHERVLFERVREESRSHGSEAQALMEPVTVDLEPSQTEVMESNLELFTKVGFRAEVFGAGSYVLRAVPRLMSSSDPGRGFVEVLDLMADGGGFESWEERAAYSIACHGAIRAGKSLTEEEMSELARQLEACQQPHTCPHGRPTMVYLSSARLEREFGRT